MSDIREQFTVLTQAQVQALSQDAWYHSIELPNGQQIPGFISVEALRARLEAFPVPEDLRGQPVFTTMTPIVTDRLATEKNATGSGEFYPYGEPMSASSDTYGTYKMSTRANAYYARNRWYDSAMGRFTTPDPYGGSAKLTNPGSWNRYAYVGRRSGKFQRSKRAFCSMSCGDKN